MESISLLATMMKKSLNQLEDDTGIQRRRHFHPSYETDIEMCSTALKATGMMRLNIPPLVLKDHLAPGGKNIAELPKKIWMDFCSHSAVIFFIWLHFDSNFPKVNKGIIKFLTLYF